MLCQLFSGGLFRAPVFEKLSGKERLKSEIDLVMWKKAWRNLKNLLFSSQMEHKCVVKVMLGIRLMLVYSISAVYVWNAPIGSASCQHYTSTLCLFSLIDRRAVRFPPCRSANEIRRESDQLTNTI